MKNLTIGKRIALAFLSVIIITAAMGIFAYTRAAIIKKDASINAQRAIPAMHLANDLAFRVQGINLRIYKHVGSQDFHDMAQMEEEIAKYRAIDNTNFAGLEAFFPTGNIHELVAKSKDVLVEFRRVTDQILVASRETTNVDGNVAVYRTARTQLDPVQQRFNDSIDAVVSALNQEASETSASIVSAAQNSQSGVLMGLILAIIAAAVISMAIVRDTNRVLTDLAVSLNDGANQVASAASQVSTASQTLAEGTSEQAASIEETSSSLEEMSSMTKRNSESAVKAKELAKQTRHAADIGAADMQSMSQAMETIKASSAEIGKIIKTIDEIAFQTNILALNAAVEAARAGEAGMGFAVVAEEVRNLAQRSAQAARETADKIEGAITKTEQGVVISSKVLHGLQDIVSKVRQVDDLVAEVASSSLEQSQGIEQVNKAIGEMDKVTQNNAATAEESASASEELSGQADSLKEAVASLITLVGQLNVNSTPGADSRSSTAFHSGKGFGGGVTVEHHSEPDHSPKARALPHKTVKAFPPKTDANKMLPMDGDFTDQ